MLKVTTILVDFACWSTVACVRNVALSGTKLLRLFWFLVFVAMVVAFVAQLVMIILKYIAFPADVSTTIVFSSQTIDSSRGRETIPPSRHFAHSLTGRVHERPFPDVTFCNYNPYKWSVVSTNPDFDDIKRMMIEYRDADAGGNSTTNEFGFQGLSRYERQDRATDLLVFMAAQLTDAQKDPALYDLEELVTECLFEGVTCDPELIEEHTDPVYGRCFVYRGGNQTISRSGLAHGLRLILTANLADSFTFVSDFLPTTRQVGVRMTVNEEDSLVSLDNHGFNVGVGYQTSIALSKARTERIQEPYGHCINEMAAGTNYYDDLPYTIDSCFTSCLQKRIVESCGCAHPSYRKAGNDTWCSTVDDASCIASLRGDQLNSNQTNLSPITDCGCRPPCKETYFSSTLSVLTYPAFGYTVGVGTTNQLKDLKKDQENKTTPAYSTQSTTTTLKTTKTTTPHTTTTTSQPTPVPSSPTTSTPTTPTTSTTTKSLTTTSPACPNSYTNTPAYVTAYNTIMSSPLFKPDTPHDPCIPRFICDPTYSKDWWKCWPCYYECPNGDRLPTADYPTPNVKCSVFFQFAQVDVGFGDAARTTNSSPAFNGWVGGNPDAAACSAEKAKMQINWVTDCSAIQTLLWSGSSGWLANGASSGSNKPTAQPLTPSTNWYDSWPCSYKCADNSRFPTNPKLPNVKCVDFFDCYKVNTDKFTNKPNFPAWANGGNGNDDCSAMQNGGGGGPPVITTTDPGPIVPPGPAPGNPGTSTTTATTTTPGNAKTGAGGGGGSSTTTIVPPLGGGLAGGTVGNGGADFGRRKKRSTSTNTTTDKNIGMPGKGSCESWNINFKNVEECQTWYKRNGMIVNVYYETLEYQVLTESPAYSLSEAVNDLGGQAGLWLGLSVVSCVECVGLFFMIFLFCITGKRMSVNGERERRDMPDMGDLKATAKAV